MQHKTYTEVVDPNTLSPTEKKRFSTDLFACHTRIFGGVDRDSFQAYVVDSTCERTRIQVARDEEGRLMGYCAVHTFVVERDGTRHVILRAETGYDRSLRARTVGGGLIVSEVLRAALRYPRSPRYFLGCLVHPSSYLALSRHAAVCYPAPGQEVPARITDLIEALEEHFRLEAVEGRSGIYKVGWVTRESDAERRSWQARDCDRTRLFLARNPGYVRGEGLLTLLPLDPGQVLRGILSFARQQLRRQVRSSRLSSVPVFGFLATR